MNPWKSPYTLWLEKTGSVEPEDISDKDVVHFGTLLEPIVAQEFCRREGKKVKQCGLYRSKQYPFMTASFDRLLVGEDAGLECKTTSAYKGKDWEAGKIPPSYYVQCMHYMMISGLPKWYIACLIGGNKFVTWEIDRDEDDIAALMEAEIKFWEKVQRQIPPEVDGSDSCTKALQERFSGGQIEPVTLPKEAIALLDRYDELKELEADIKAQKQDIQNHICELLGNNEIGLVGEGENARKVTWKTVAGRTTIDAKKLKAEMPDVFEKYAKKSADSRRFSV
jgi:putative phage-type endonuclease